MAQSDGFAGKSDEWRAGYLAGVDAFSAELKASQRLLVDRFLSWPLPQSVCSDLCVTDRSYKFPRSGTNLLTADEARQMIEYLLGDPRRSK
jgi:hypothetical protein